MYWSQMLIPTLRQALKEVDRVAAILTRAGYSFVSDGKLTAFLPLGVLCLDKLKRELTARLLARGAEKITPFFYQRAHGLAPDIPRPESLREPSDLPGTSAVNRLFREIAARYLHSYNQLPQLWFCFAPDSRECARCFIHCISLSLWEQTRNIAPDGVPQIFLEVAGMLGLPIIRANGLPRIGQEGPATEFLCLSPDGNIEVVQCACGYAVNLDCAVSKGEESPDKMPVSGQPRLVETPGMKTIADVSDYLCVPPSSLIKSLLYIASSGPLLVLVRGDDQLNEYHLQRALHSTDLRPANPEEIRKTLGADPGSIGPVGVQHIRILADDSLRSAHGMASGANKDDYHLTGVEPERDFHAEYIHLRQVCAGDSCLDCGKPLIVSRARLLLRSATFLPSSQGLGPLRVLGPDNRPQSLLATTHRLDLNALLFSVIERSSDEDGLILPPAIAPFDVLVTPVRYNDSAQKSVCDRAYDLLRGQNLRVLIDDRDLTPGVKFKDADLIGIPLRVTIGPKKLNEGKVELRLRATGETFDCPVEDVSQHAARILCLREPTQPAS